MKLEEESIEAEKNLLKILLIIKGAASKVDKRIVKLPEIHETREYITELKLHLKLIARIRLNVFAN
ncbi:hypothetical protein HN51_044273 [Arachis hypogaea]